MHPDKRRRGRQVRKSRRIYRDVSRAFDELARGARKASRRIGYMSRAFAVRPAEAGRPE